MFTTFRIHSLNPSHSFRFTSQKYILFYLLFVPYPFSIHQAVKQQQQLAIGVGVEGNKNLSKKCYFLIFYEFRQLIEIESAKNNYTEKLFFYSSFFASVCLYYKYTLWNNGVREGGREVLKPEKVIAFNWRLNGVHMVPKWQTWKICIWIPCGRPENFIHFRGKWFSCTRILILSL